MPGGGTEWCRWGPVPGHVPGDHGTGEHHRVRHGAHRRGEYVAEVLVLNADDGGVSVVVRRPEGGARLTTYMERVSEFLEAAVVLDGQQTANKIEKGVEGKGGKIRAALHSLIEEGFVEVERTSKGHFHRLVRPYRQATDPASDRFEEPGGPFLDAVREVASNGVQPVENPAEDPDLVPRPDLVPTSSRTNPEPDLVPSSPPYVVGGTRDEVAVYEEPAETPRPRPSFLAPDPDELDVPDEDLDA